MNAETRVLNIIQLAIEVAEGIVCREMAKDEDARKCLIQNAWHFNDVIPTSYRYRIKTLAQKVEEYCFTLPPNDNKDIKDQE